LQVGRLPANQLAALTGSRRGQHLIRFNDQRRICCTWTKDGPADLEIIDTTNAIATLDRLTAHPGEVLNDEFLKPLRMPINTLPSGNAHRRNRQG
jgi:toxin HigB-1